jgi:nitrogenase molybdenum-cofactor synthesis protein NifE
MGIEVVSIMTGDGRVDQVRRSHGAALNVVQCSGALTFLAEMMKETYGIPYIRASYFGIDDMAKALYDVAAHFSEAPEIMARTREIVRSEVETIMPEINRIGSTLPANGPPSMWAAPSRPFP